MHVFYNLRGYIMLDNSSAAQLEPGTVGDKMPPARGAGTWKYWWEGRIEGEGIENW